MINLEVRAVKGTPMSLLAQTSVSKTKKQEVRKPLAFSGVGGDWVCTVLWSGVMPWAAAHGKPGHMQG